MTVKVLSGSLAIVESQWFGTGLRGTTSEEPKPNWIQYRFWSLKQKEKAYFGGWITVNIILTSTQSWAIWEDSLCLLWAAKSRQELSLVGTGCTGRKPLHSGLMVVLSLRWSVVAGRRLLPDLSSAVVWWWKSFP